MNMFVGVGFFNHLFFHLSYFNIKVNIKIKKIDNPS